LTAIIKKVKRRSRKAIKHLSPFKGGKGQDKWVILTALPFKKSGFFLDLAASNGITNNNTFVLEKKFGWNGICIEPNPIFFQKLKKNRNCIIDNSVVSDKNEVVNFRVDNGGNGGIVAEDTDNNSRTRSEELTNARIITLESTTLTQLLDKHNAPSIIDYFSLDVEGSEERIIRSFNFEKYRFNCLTIERPTPKVNQILFDKGYLFVKNRKFDSFYIHKSLSGNKKINYQSFEQIPPKEY
jgi:FkbM family methyltransferase